MAMRKNRKWTITVFPSNIHGARCSCVSYAPFEGEFESRNMVAILQDTNQHQQSESESQMGICKHVQRWRHKFLKNIFWTDETNINLYQTDRNAKCGEKAKMCLVTIYRISFYIETLRKSKQREGKKLQTLIKMN